MPEKNTAAPLLPARLLEILAALPMNARVETSQGEILARKHDLPKEGELPAPLEGSKMLPLHSELSPPSHKTGARRGAGRSTRDARAPQIAAYPLPPIKGCPQDMRLVTLVSDERKTDCQALIISTLLVLLLGETQPAIPRLTPQQHAILHELSLGLEHKEAAYALGISHDTLRTQVARMRRQQGDGIIPRIRRRGIATKTPS